MDLKNLTRADTVEAMTALGVERYRGDQVFRWVHARGADDFAAMTDLGKALRETLAATATIERLTVDTIQLAHDGTRKLRLRTKDGRFIESVLIPDGEAASDDEDDSELLDPQSPSIANHQPQGPSPRSGGAIGSNRETGNENEESPLAPRRRKLTLCISSQIGCALDCRFCATATLGFARNLEAGEIVDQVYRARALLDGLPADDPTRLAGSARITNLVYMGMGEPLHNLANVVRSIEILTDSMGMDLSPRRITVSTAGLVPAIRKFGEAKVRANLAVSLNATTDAVRDEIMPINRKWKIAELLAAVRAFPLARRQRVTFEYVLLDGVNDSLEDARRLPGLLHGIPTKVNLIPWNPHPAAAPQNDGRGASPPLYGRPSERAVARFQEELKERGLAVYVRRPRGDDIDAACGQLAARGGERPVTLRT